MDALYKAFVYYPDEYDRLPTDPAALAYIAANCPPMSFHPDKDLDRAVAYLCEPRCLQNGAHFEHLYVAGTDTKTTQTQTMVEISQSPTRTFRETLVRLADAPTPAKAAQYASILRNWANRSLYTGQDAALMVDTLDYRRTQLELNACICVITMSFMQIRALLDAPTTTLALGWIAKLYDVACFLKREYYPDNKGMQAALAKIACCIALRRPGDLRDLAAYHALFLARNLTAQGFLICEVRRNMTIEYHYRFLVMFLLGQVLLRAAGAQVVAPGLQATLAKAIANVSAYADVKSVLAPTPFHAFASWTGAMSSVSERAVAGVRQMHAFAYADPDPAKLVDAVYDTSSFTMARVSALVRAVVGPRPVADGVRVPAPLFVFPGQIVAVPLSDLFEGAPPGDARVARLPPSVAAATASGTALQVTAAATWADDRGQRLECASGTRVAAVPVRVMRPVQLELAPGKGGLRFDAAAGLLRLRAGEELPLALLDSPEIRNAAKGWRGIATPRGLLRASARTVKPDASPNVYDDEGVAWDIRPDGTVWNAGGFLGYDAAADTVVVTAPSAARVRWAVRLG